MIKPPLSVGCVDQRTLMRAVDIRRPLFQSAFPLIRTVNARTAQYRVPAFAHTTFGDAEIIISILLQKLCALSYGTLIHRLTFIQQMTAIRRHPMHDDRTGTMLTTT